MPSPNVERLAGAYGLWAESKGSSTEHWLDLLADEVDFRSFADSLPQIDFAQPYRKKEEVRRYLDGLVGGWEMIAFEVDRFIEQGDDVVMVGRTAWRNRQTGKTIDTLKVDLWRFRDDKAVSYMELIDTAQLVECCRSD